MLESVALGGKDVAIPADQSWSILRGGKGKDQISGGVNIDWIFGGEGDDTLIGGQGNDFLQGDQGADELEGDEGDDVLDGDAPGASEGNSGPDSIWAGPGNDELWGRRGADELSGDEGNDTAFGGLGDDFIDGGDGVDLLDGDEPNLSDTGSDTIEGGNDNDQIFGRDGGDQLSGGEGNDTIHGAQGDDFILGEGGADQLFGDEGDDNMDGGTGNDVVRGGIDKDAVNGGDGADMVFGESGFDQVFGGEGNDTIEGGAGIDIMNGGGGDDVVVGGTLNLATLGAELDGADWVNGDIGNDIVIGDNGSIVGGVIRTTLGGGGAGDTAWGGGGNDTVLGGVGADNMSGEGGIFPPGTPGGNDVVIGDEATVTSTNISTTSPGTGGDDTIEGGGGNDIIIGGDGKDFLDGGSGNDIELGDQAQVTLFLGLISSVATINPTLGGDDVINGGGGNDQIFGSAGKDSINGQDGDDVVFGELGNDLINGGKGADTLRGNDGGDELHGDEDVDLVEGNAGNDTIFGGDGDDKLVGGGATELDQSGNDNISGDAGNDTVLGDDGIIGSVTLLGGSGADILSGGSGNDVIYGQGGADQISGGLNDDDLYGNAGGDVIHGDDGVDRIFGGDDNDQIFGEGGADVIRGDAGNDTLAGNDGDDQILGGVNDDNIEGGAGADLIFGGDGNDIAYGQVNGGAGDDNAADQIYGESGNDQLFGNGGADALDGGVGVDTLRGGGGDDHLAGGGGVGDSVLGEDGNDQIVGSDDGADVDPNFADAVYFGDIIDGGLGDDTIDALAGADNIDGGEGNDSIDSGTGRDLVHGSGGNDWIFGGVGTFGDQIFGDAGGDLIYGSPLGNDTVSGGDDNDRIFGQGGQDVLAGDAGDDSVDGGADADSITGGLGNDELLGGGGTIDTLDGGAGEDTLRGSDDGADLIIGGTERDRIFGNGGNDTASGGSGADTMDGGAGDDSISGDEGADLLLGGANHDIIFGHRSGGAGDDNSVDFIYGDFGTNANEVGSGRDQIFGQGGNDLMFGEGDDDQITPGGGATNLVNFGAGEGANPNDFVPPTPTPAPPINAVSVVLHASGTLPVGVGYLGRWDELSSSASGAGTSASRAAGIEESVAADATGRYVAWADARNGNFEVYVARYTAGAWQMLSGSAQDGGVSNTSTSSRRPSITLDTAGNPIVAWTEFTSTGNEIRAARFAGGSWLSLGTVSAGAGGTADSPKIVNTTSGPLIAWLNTSGGVSSVYVKQLVGASWNAIGSSASGAGVSSAGVSASNLAIATDGTKVAFAWSQEASGVRQVYLKELGGGTFNQLSGSASGNGVSATTGNSDAPTLAYSAGSLFVAWQNEEPTTRLSEIFAARYDSAGTKTIISATGGGVSSTRGNATQPRLAAGGSTLYLVWADDRLASRNASGVSLYARRWNGVSFVEELANDASFAGVASAGSAALGLDLAVDNAGKPFVAWEDQTAGTRQVMARANSFANVANVFTTSAGLSVQNILDANDLGVGDVILISGNSAGFTIAADDAGVLIQGLPGSLITGNISVSVADVVLNRLAVNGSLTISSDRDSLYNSTISGGVTINGGSNSQLAHNTINGPTALTLAPSAFGAIVEHNVISGTTTGVALSGAGGILVRDNRISGATGVSIAAASSGTLQANDISATTTGLNITALFTGPIDSNDIHGATTGINYTLATNLSGNRIHNNTTGVVTTVAGTTNGFGFVSPNIPNEIYSNVTGVNLTGQMQNQHIWSNTTGVIGSGILGGSDFALPNLIEKNTTGVNGFTGPIQFNRIASNGVGINAANGQKIFHNLIYRNTQQGVLVSGKSDVRIVSNTMYSSAGDNIRIQNSSSNVEIRDNVLWADGGYDIFAANDSLIGYWSDYNQLHAGPGGKIIHWVKDFTDILDWQADLAQFDLHSIGTTVVNPLWSQPAFVNASFDDYRIFDVVAGQRFSSPGIDSGDPLTDQGLAANVTNLLANPGFETGISGWLVSPSGSTKSATPSAFEGSNYFFAGSISNVSAEQTIDLLAAGFSAAQLDSQDLVAIFGGRVRSLAETLKDRGQIVLSFLNGTGGVISQRAVTATNVSDRWELIGDDIALPVGTRQIRYRFEATLSSGGNGINDSYLDGAFLRIVSENGAPDLGAYGNTSAEATLGTTPHIALRSPDLYLDWERDKPRQILWDSYGNTGDSPVKIELYQDTPDGPQLVTTIAAAASDSGSFTWIPANSGVNFGTNGLRIQISLVSNQAVLDRSTETFSVPTSGDNFYADDASNTDDQYTPGAIGSNRNTGKLPTSPKPYANNILRIYTLGPAQTIFVDDGSYAMMTPIVLSGSGVMSDDEGFTFTGPTNAGTEAIFTLANPNTVAPIIELDDADFTTISYLTLDNGQYGIWAHNGSTNFASSHLTVSGNDLDGVRFETNSTVTSIDHLHALNNGRYGIFVSGEIGSLSDSSVHNNANNGVHLLQPRGVLVEANEVFANGGDGIYVENTALPAATIGNANLALSRGNRVHDNSGSGIRGGASGVMLVAGNTVYGHSGTNDVGIVLDGPSSSALRNVTYNNFDGISANSGALVNENRSYHNSNSGISLNVLSGLTSNANRNVVYSNNLGILVGTNFSGLLANNLIYANTSAGVQMSGAGSFSGAPKLVNNTIFQPAGDAVRLIGTSRNVELRNNILVVGAARAINVAADSQAGFKSDFNLFRTTGAGRVGFWQGADRPTLASWQAAVFVDQNSLFQDPVFVDVDGPDNQLGFVGSTADGDDDDFHLQSQVGSFHGGALAPISVGGALPIFPTATLTADANQSPAIDRGDSTDAFANEPAPNGGFINLGFEGNTDQASKSPASYMLVTLPDGGEAWLANQTFPIRWRSHNTAATVDVELMQVGNPTPIMLIADDTANDGEFQWTIPNTITPADNYLIRVTRNDTATSDTSNAPFSIGAPITIYFVNDGTVAAGDWTTAAGNDANNGLSPVTPKASIRAILDAYDLGPGDIIRVDNGSYTLTTNIPITANDSGVRIEGYNDVANPAGRALVNRGSTGGTSFAFELAGADDVTIDHMQITGGFYGIGTSTTTDSDRITVTNSIIFSNSSAGMAILASNDNWSVSNNTFFGATGAVQPTGLIIDGSDASITNNIIRDHSNNGISVTGGGSIISNNDITGAARGITAGTPSNVTRKITISGNLIHDNLTFGIDAARFVSISGNKIYRHEGTNDAAINMSDASSEARDNVIFDNYNGIVTVGNIVVGNHVYNATNNAILATLATLVQGNQLYSNRVGISTSNNFSGRITNNRIYGNTLYGMQISALSGTPLIVNNTVFEPTATAIRLEGGARNVMVNNNILAVGSAYAISMADDSQLGFVSDYNLFQLTGAGKIGLWEGTDYLTWLDWTYEVGLDRHSKAGDAMLADPDGADNVLGFSTGPVGPATIIDDGDPGYSQTGTWAASTPGFNGDYRQNTGSATASWTFSGLIPGAYYTLAATWPVKATFDTSTVYTVRDGDRTPISVTVNPRTAPADFNDAGTAWKTLGRVRASGDTLVVTLTDTLVVPADAIRLQQLGGDQGLDDDFHLLPNSPAIDGGNPTAFHLSEPFPNSDRADIGAYGNTPEAALSAPQLVQILSPNGFEKVEAGQATPISWRSAGMTQTRPVALINTGGPDVGLFTAGNYAITPFTNLQAISFTPNISGVSDPAPVEVYTTLMIAGSANRLTFALPVTDGTYNIRLHFMEPSANGINQRKFDILLNGTMVRDDFDIFAATGGNYRATTLSFPVTASSSSGILLDLVNQVSAAVISAIEITAANPAGVAAPTIDLELSTNNGASWTPIANGLAVDRFGSGSFMWTPSDTTAGRTALIRATANGSQAVHDSSDDPFTIVDGTHDYYVNDGSTTGDSFTTAVGNNLNDGKSPARPMASIGALLAAYDLDAGDVIHVDNGTYNLSRNILLTAEDSGVRIEGPATGEAILDRGNTANNIAVFELRNADNITLDRLSITDGFYGVFADNTSDSDDLTITNSKIFGNLQAGIFLDATNDRLRVTSNTINFASGRQNTGINYAANDGVISGNSIFGHTLNGILIGGGARTLITGNDVFNNARGMNTGAFPPPPLTITNNLVHGNTIYGIGANSNAVITGNTVFAHTASNSIGIDFSGFSGGGAGSGNVIFGNQIGARASNNTLLTGNRFYNNVTAVDAAFGGRIDGNQIYSNTVGVVLGTGRAVGNRIYGNTSQALIVRGQSVEVTGNTIYQPVGDGVRVDTNSQNVKLTSNIIWTQTGSGINVTDDSQIGFVSDYNLLFATGTGKLATWQGRAFTNRADWWYEVGQDQHSVSADPLFVDVDGPDNALGFVGGVDRGADDDFHVLPASPTIDAGDPFAFYYSEPTPNGGRINQGNYGNTPEATASAQQVVQVLSPNGFEKLEVGKPVNIQWRTSGITAEAPIALINFGGPTVGKFLSGTALFGGGGNTIPSTTVVDISGVTDPAPQQVYQTYATFGRMTVNLPLPAGQYNVRMHFVEPTSIIPGQRVFDILAQSQMIRDDFDIFPLVGRNKATTVSFPVTATGSSGVLLELVNQVNQPVISAIEITAANPIGSAAPTVGLDLSLDNGLSWTPLAQGLGVDRFGDGSFTWTPETASSANNALIRARTELPPVVRDTSDQPFLIAPAGHDYYVNDATTTGDSFTTALGNNFNSGKSPSQPMATLAALLAAYDLEIGDVVHLDAGSYTLLRNILLANDDSGVRIEGANLPLLNRANTIGTMVFDLQRADDVTIDGVQMTGAAAGINQFQTGGSDRFTLSNSRIFGNSLYGLNLDGATEFATITGNTVFGIPGGSINDNQSSGGIIVFGADATISNNTVFDHATSGAPGISLGNNFGGIRAKVIGNEVYGNSVGIFAANLQSLTDPDRILISGNKVHDNLTFGIDGNSSVIISGNTVFNQVGSSRAGIRSQGTTVDVINNTVFGNTDGIIGSSGRVIGNRSFNNVRYGITISGATETRANVVYSNSIGIQIGGAPGVISDNLVYGNTNQGIFIQGALNSQLYNNTIYQVTGEAVRIEGGSGTALRNNIISVQSGYDIFLNTAAQTGFTSNYNVLTRSNDPNARIGFWNGANRLTLADWQSATAGDASSISADPLFIDIDGADNVFGGNGGLDDNFYLSKNSPAIDRGDSWRAPIIDQSGAARADDPGTANTGSPMYVASDLGSNQFSAIGTARNFRSNGNSFNFTLPFSFPFYDASFTTVSVSTEGYLLFGNGNAGDGLNSDAKMLQARRIAPLWDNLSTFGVNDDVFIDTATANQVTFRWNATNEADNSDVNFSATLFSDGRVRFHYGAGNTNLTPTIGIAMGNNLALTLPGYNGQANLTNANSIEFSLAPGIIDIGAYEFRGSSLDVVPPTITASIPSAIHASGNTSAFNNITLSFSEPINPIDAAAAANYELRSAGTDGIFDNADDVIVPLAPNYINGALSVDLALGSLLLAGNYRFTAFGGSGRSIHDLSGLVLDGDGVGGAGGNYVRNFTVNSTPSIVGTSGDDIFVIRLNAPANRLDVWQNRATNLPASFSYAFSGTTSITFDGGVGNDKLIVDMRGGNPIPNGGINFTGGADFDQLDIIGSGGSGSYTPSGTIPGDGNIVAGGKMISFTGLEPVEVSGFADFSLITPNANDTLTLDNPAAGKSRISGTSGGVSFESLTFFGIPTILIDAAANDGGAGNDSINIGPDGLAASGLALLRVNAGSGVNTLTIDGGVINLDASAGAGGNNLDVALNNSAQVTLSGSQRLHSLDLNQNSRLNVAGAFLRVGALSIDPSAKLDLGANDLIIQSTAADKAATFASLIPLLRTGRSAGAWDGVGISSSAAASDPRHVTGLAAVINDTGDGATRILTTLSGETVDVNTILIKYSYNGDSNLDGLINADDYANIDAGFASHATGYRNGDFNYSGGTPNPDDYFLIDKAFFDQSAVLTPSATEQIAAPAEAQSLELKTRPAQHHQPRRHHHRRRHQPPRAPRPGDDRLLFRRRD